MLNGQSRYTGPLATGTAKPDIWMQRIRVRGQNARFANAAGCGSYDLYRPVGRRHPIGGLAGLGAVPSPGPCTSDYYSADDERLQPYNILAVKLEGAISLTDGGHYTDAYKRHAELVRDAKDGCMWPAARAEAWYAAGVARVLIDSRRAITGKGGWTEDQKQNAYAAARRVAQLKVEYLRAKAGGVGLTQAQIDSAVRDIQAIAAREGDIAKKQEMLNKAAQVAGEAHDVAGNFLSQIFGSAEFKKAADTAKLLLYGGIAVLALWAAGQFFGARKASTVRSML